MATKYSSYFIPKKSKTQQEKVAEALGVSTTQVNPGVNQTNQTTTTTKSKKSSGGGSSSSSSNNSSSTQSLAPTVPTPIDMEELQKNLASGKTKIQISDTERNRQIQQQSIKGGTFVNPYGGIISSAKSELELNQGKLNEPVKEKKDYFEQFGRTPFAEVLSKGKRFVGSFVKIGEIGADQKEVDEQANIFISKAKDKYVKNIFSNITENQKLKQEFEEEQAKLKKEQDRQQEIIERNKYKQQAEQEAKEGKISGGLKLAGLKIIELGQKVGESKAKINLLPTDPTFVLSKVLGNAPKQFTSGFIQGVGETAKGAGDIVSAASKRSTYVKLAKAGKGTAEYFINVGKTAKIKGVKIKPGDLFPVQLDVEAGDKTKKDIEAAKLLGLTAAGKAAENFAKDPFTETGKLIAGGLIAGKATNLIKTSTKIALSPATTRLLGRETITTTKIFGKTKSAPIYIDKKLRTTSTTKGIAEITIKEKGKGFLNKGKIYSTTKLKEPVIIKSQLKIDELAPAKLKPKIVTSNIKFAEKSLKGTKASSPYQLEKLEEVMGTNIVKTKGEVIIGYPYTSRISGAPRGTKLIDIAINKPRSGKVINQIDFGTETNMTRRNLIKLIDTTKRDNSFQRTVSNIRLIENTKVPTKGDIISKTFYKAKKDSTEVMLSGKFTSRAKIKLNNAIKTKTPLIKSQGVSKSTANYFKSPEYISTLPKTQQVNINLTSNANNIKGTKTVLLTKQKTTPLTTVKTTSKQVFAQPLKVQQAQIATSKAVSKLNFSQSLPKFKVIPRTKFYPLNTLQKTFSRTKQKTGLRQGNKLNLINKTSLITLQNQKIVESTKTKQVIINRQGTKQRQGQQQKTALMNPLPIKPTITIPYKPSLFKEKLYFSNQQKNPKTYFYGKKPKSSRYGLKNVIKFNSFGKVKDSKVRFI